MSFVQSMFALSRAVTDDGPLQIYLAISALESRRSPEHRLAPATVRLLAQKIRHSLAISTGSSPSFKKL